ncbi:5-hydroxytryptamine receptor [Trichoplax sp. H2]|nr:5-hydroxytryptamine receptor [Trichoplax sp. H2]|eukprot:RDD40430.1 5-hydroxytryptamine receptor [Trichoplax sp. H2]
MDLTFFIIMAILLFLSMIVNTLVILMMFRVRNLQNGFNYVLTNVAVTDILLTLSMIYIIMSTSGILSVSTMPLVHIILCKVSHFLTWYAITVIAWTNVAIAHYRFIRMLSPLWRRRATKLHTKRRMMIIWIVALFIMIVRLYGYIAGYRSQKRPATTLVYTSSLSNPTNFSTNSPYYSHNGSYYNTTTNITTDDDIIPTIYLSTVATNAIETHVQVTLCNCLQFTLPLEYYVAKYLTIVSITLSYCLPFAITLVIYVILGYRLWIIFTGRRKGLKPRIIQNLARYRKNTITFAFLFVIVGILCVLPLAMYELWPSILRPADNIIFLNIATTSVVAYPLINSLLIICITNHSLDYLLVTCGCTRFSHHSITNPSLATSRQNLKSNYNISLRSITATA